MKKKDILHSALVVTVLTINPLFTASLTASINKPDSISFNIARILYSRGLNDSAAREIAESFLEEDEELFALMLKNIISDCGVLSENEIMNYLSSLALQRKSIDLKSYASLVNMVQKIKSIAPSKETLKELQNIAIKNSVYTQQVL